MKKIKRISLLLVLVLLLQCGCSGRSTEESMPGLVPVTVEDDNAVSNPSIGEASDPTETTSPYVDPNAGMITYDSDAPFGMVSIQEGCRSIEAMKPLAGSERLLPSAAAVVVYERKTNTMIYSYNPDMQMAPGTLSKMVTALVAIELCELDEVVRASSRNISKLPPQSQHVDLKEGEELTVRDLLHCLILHSANDAAVALAEHVSGNQEGFVVLMNDRVKRMGCTKTGLANVHGLNNVVQYTTARDMTRIMLECLKNETLAEILGTAKYTVPETNRSKERPLTTTNYTIDNSIIPQFYDTRVKNGMGSYMESTGASLVVNAKVESSRANRNLDVVFVIMGALREFEDNGWQPKVYGNFEEMVDLMEYTFNNFKVHRILYDGQALHQFPVIDGESEVVGQPHVNYDTVLPADCQMDNLIRNFSVVDKSLTAPVSADQMIATVELWYRSSCVAEAELYAMSDVVSEQGSGVRIQSTVSRNDSESGGFMSVLGVICVVVLGIVGGYLLINNFRRVRSRSRHRRRRASRRRSW